MKPVNDIKVTLISLNVRGLISNINRKKAFLWLEKQKADIILLQETHCTEKNVEMIKKDWKGKSIFCYTDSNFSRGVGILFKV